MTFRTPIRITVSEILIGTYFNGIGIITKNDLGRVIIFVKDRWVFEMREVA